MKVIIWGFPLYSHTHSYIHYGWYKAFKHMGYETYWFHDKEYPQNFDYSNCLFLTEGYADNNIPIHKTSTYFVHMCKNPSKYLEKDCRLIDIRFNIKQTKDFTYDYSLDKTSMSQLDQCTFYESNANDSALRKKFRKNISGYEAVYTSWATDRLPTEFVEKEIYIPRERKIWYVGSIWSANYYEIENFKLACAESGVDFIHRNPWGNKATNEDLVKLTQKSYIAPDIRGKGLTCGEDANVTAKECNHIDIGYIPCRVFKNISYGQLGGTNSPAVSELFGDIIIYNPDTYGLFYDCEKNKQNFKLIKEQMEYVKNNHTFVNRANSILKVYYKL